jgi:hypothetical protein
MVRALLIYSAEFVEECPKDKKERTYCLWLVRKGKY